MTACARCSFDPDATISDSWSFHVDREIKSGNARIVNGSVTRWVYAKNRDAWQWELRTARLLQGAPKATGKRRVTLTRHYTGRQRPFDRDNLATGCKVVVDAMVREGLLVNDDAGSAEIHYAQAKSETPGVAIVVEVLA